MACWACLKFQCFFKTVIQNMHAERQAQYMLISLGVVDIGFDINGGSLRVRQMILWLGKLKKCLPCSGSKGVLYWGIVVMFSIDLLQQLHLKTGLENLPVLHYVEPSPPSLSLLFSGRKEELVLQNHFLQTASLAKRFGGTVWE